MFTVVHRWLVSVALLCAALGADAIYGRAVPELHDLRGSVENENSAPLAGAVCTLTGQLLPPAGLSVTTDAKGNFDFPGIAPGTYDLTCAAVGYEPVEKANVQITEEPPPFLQLVLPAEIVVKQSVEVSSKGNRVSQQQAAPPATLSAPQLRTLPLVQQKFKAALPLVPGVVRTPDGKINIKGAVETQGVLLVDNAEMVDPITGSFSIEVPIDAVQSLQVYKSAYLAQYGRFSGGLTRVETKAPSNAWHFELNDFLPTPRIKSGHIVGIADDEPRLYLTGPLRHDKLNFSEAFEYNLIKQPVRGLAYPHNEIKTEGVNSFTSFQYIVSPQHLLSIHADIFPEHREFADINSLVPQPASSNYGQKGFSASANDNYLFPSGSILTTLFQYTKFDSYAHGQGPANMLVTPNGWGGNFFDAYQRASNQEEFQQNFQFSERDWHGKHQVLMGADYLRRAYTGTNVAHPIILQRLDGTPAEQITFQGPGILSTKDGELAGFLQDHWAFTDQFAMDAGARLSSQTVGEPVALAPRVGFVYAPGKSGRTIFRSGVGVFYDRISLLAGDFIENPERVLTFFNNQGVPLGPPVAFLNAYIKVNEQGQQIVPSRNRLDSTPHNLTWNAELDQELLPGLLLRLSYLSSRTYQQFIVNPLILPNAQPTLLLSNTGNSRYHELESTVRYRAGESANLNFSYVRSSARGDLNTLSDIFVPFEQPVIRPNFFATLPSNIPNRFITWSTFQLPAEVTVSPVLDVHDGFPYSNVDVLQNYVGVPNAFRFPAFASLDLKLTKDFRIPFLPWLRHHKFQGALAVFNLTDHANPRDVYNNVASPYFGHFVGFQHRFFDAYLDIVD
jgi:hypothetical protein